MLSSLLIEAASRMSVFSYYTPGSAVRHILSTLLYWCCQVICWCTEWRRYIAGDHRSGLSTILSSPCVHSRSQQST